MDSEVFLRELGQRVRARRHQIGLNQERLAESAGLSPRYLSQLESGRGNISVVRLYELARALGVPLEELLKTDHRRRIVALIGLRGAGKTTIGKLLAREIRRPFLELDALIEYNGLVIDHKYGDYEGAPFGPESEKQLIVCSAAR